MTQSNVREPEKWPNGKLILLMKCGHVSQGVKVTYGTNVWPSGKNKPGDKIGFEWPACVICDCIDQVFPQPDLIGRTARCTYGCKPVPSSLSLAFFSYHPNKREDRYYCGCYGWD